MKYIIAIGIAAVLGFLLFRKARETGAIPDSSWNNNPAPNYTAGYVPNPIPMNPTLAVTSPNVGAALVTVGVAGGCTVAGGPPGACGSAGVVAGAITSYFGKSTKVCRCAANNKDVFPNDMAMGANYGIFECQKVGQLWNPASRKWPWQ